MISKLIGRLLKISGIVLTIGALGFALYSILPGILCDGFQCEYLGPSREVGGLAALSGLLLLILMRGKDGGALTGVSISVLAMLAAVGLSPSIYVSAQPVAPLDERLAGILGSNDPRVSVMRNPRVLEIGDDINHEEDIELPSRGVAAGKQAYKITLKRDATLRFNVDTIDESSGRNRYVESDPKITIYGLNEDGTRIKIAENDNFAAGYNSEITGAFEAGDYAILLEDQKFDAVSARSTKLKLRIADRTPSVLIPESRALKLAFGEGVSCDLSGASDKSSSCRRVADTTPPDEFRVDNYYYRIEIDKVREETLLCLILDVQATGDGAKGLLVLDVAYEALDMVILYPGDPGDLRSITRANQKTVVVEVASVEPSMKFDLVAELREADASGACVSNEEYVRPIAN